MPQTEMDARDPIGNFDRGIIVELKLEFELVPRSACRYRSIVTQT
jgi:hypothetical protein